LVFKVFIKRGGVIRIIKKMLRDFLISKVYAVDYSDPNAFTSNLLGDDPTLGGTFTTVTNIIITVGLGLVLIFLAMGFIRFITSQGDKVATEQAQKWVTYAIIGGVGLFLVYAIKSLLLNFLGVDSNPLNGE